MHVWWYDCTVWVKKIPLRFSDIFPKWLWIFRIFLHTYYAIFIQLSPILTKLCHIKRDYLVHIICANCPPSAKTHAFTRLRKSFIALSVATGKSTQICCSILFSSGCLLRLWLKFVKCLKHCNTHTRYSRVGWGLLSLVDTGPLRWSRCNSPSTIPASDAPCELNTVIMSTNMSDMTWREQCRHLLST